MRKSSLLPALFFLAAVPLTGGCFHTLTGAVAGPLGGGASLTANVYESEAPTAIKIVATPFTFVGGTATGIFPGMSKGVMQDLGREPGNYAALFDPFDGFNGGRPSEGKWNMTVSREGAGAGEAADATTAQRLKDMDKRLAEIEAILRKLDKSDGAKAPAGSK